MGRILTRVQAGSHDETALAIGLTRLHSSHLIPRGASVGGITRRFKCHNTRTRVDQKFATRSFSACLRANSALPDSVFCNSCAVLLFPPVDRRPTRLVSSRLVSLFLVFNASFPPFDSKMRLRHPIWVNSERVDLHRRLATAPSRAISRAVRLRPASVRRAQHGDHARNQALRQVDVR